MTYNLIHIAYTHAHVFTHTHTHIHTHTRIRTQFFLIIHYLHVCSRNSANGSSWVVFLFFCFFPLPCNDAGTLVVFPINNKLKLLLLLLEKLISRLLTIIVTFGPHFIGLIRQVPALDQYMYKLFIIRWSLSRGALSVQVVVKTTTNKTINQLLAWWCGWVIVYEFFYPIYLKFGMVF